MTVAALSCAASAQQVTPTAQDPAAAIREWVRSDHSDEALREAATKAVLDAGDAGLRALADTVRRTRPDQRDRRIGVESLVATVVVGILERAHDSGMRFAGQYDRLRALQPYAGTFLVQLVVDTPDWFPDDMRALVVPALRDVYPRGPEPGARTQLRAVAEDEDFESQALRDALAYAFAQWGERDLVQPRLDEYQENAGSGSDTDELFFVRALAVVHYELREYEVAGKLWQRFVAGMQGLDAPVGAMDQYNAACTLARAGDTAGALEAIERCADLVAAGKVDSRAAITRRMFETDPDLLSIRAEERFVKATAKAFPESAAQKDGGSSRRGS
ncbi:MAG: hypothetical protein O2865_00265 [Planctomycetota bacterium]|nr:hypothetical protein [Planctomycetota bacterium]MDA0932730.1 hypothetical protein [Planctomycetota bacterium]MDA1222617.1 hypothetical protein [Planctomycetota bacterium]